MPPTYQLNGAYRAFGQDLLKRNIKILMHRPAQGMIKRFSGFKAQQFNRRYIDSMHVFYAEIAADANTPPRTSFEAAISREVEDYGQNILDVGGISTTPPGNFQVPVDTGSACIEVLTGSTLSV